MEENYTIKNMNKELNNKIIHYEEKENKLNKDQEIISDNMDYIKKYKMNEEKERLNLLEEIKNLQKLNDQIIKEKNSLLLDLQNKDLIF